MKKNNGAKGLIRREETEKFGRIWRENETGVFFVYKKGNDKEKKEEQRSNHKR